MAVFPEFPTSCPLRLVGSGVSSPSPLAEEGAAEHSDAAGEAFWRTATARERVVCHGLPPRHHHPLAGALLGEPRPPGSGWFATVYPLAGARGSPIPPRWRSGFANHPSPGSLGFASRATLSRTGRGQRRRPRRMALIR